MNHKFKKPRMQRGGCWCKSWKKMPGRSRESRLPASDRRQDDVREAMLHDVGAGDEEDEGGA